MCVRVPACAGPLPPPLPCPSVPRPPRPLPPASLAVPLPRDVRDADPVASVCAGHEGLQIVAPDDGGRALVHALGHALQKAHGHVAVQERHPLEQELSGVVHALPVNTTRVVVVCVSGAVRAQGEVGVFENGFPCLGIAAPVLEAVVAKAAQNVHALGRRNVPVPALLDLGEEPRLHQRAPGSRYVGPRSLSQCQRDPNGWPDMEAVRTARASRRSSSGWSACARQSLPTTECRRSLFTSTARRENRVSGVDRIQAVCGSTELTEEGQRRHRLGTRVNVVPVGRVVVVLLLRPAVQLLRRGHGGKDTRDRDGGIKTGIGVGLGGWVGGLG